MRQMYNIRAVQCTWLIVRSRLAADELQHHLAPVRACPVLDQIDALPSTERKRAAAHRNMQRNAGQHGLDMSRHVVGPLDYVHPGTVGGREAMQRRDEIGLHVRIGILLDHERCRGVAQIKQQHAVARPALLDKAHSLSRDVGEALAGGFEDKLRTRQQLRRDVADRRQAAGHGGTRQLFFCISRCRSTIISTSRRQTFFMNENARSSSASLGTFGSLAELSGTLAGGTGGATGASATIPLGSSRPRDSSDFLSSALSRCSRPISFSSAARSSGTILQDQPVAAHPHCASWPVRESSRTKPSPMRWKL